MLTGTGEEEAVQLGTDTGHVAHVRMTSQGQGLEEAEGPGTDPARSCDSQKENIIWAVVSRGLNSELRADVVFMWSDVTGVWEQGEKGDTMPMQGAGWGGLSWVLPVERSAVGVCEG